MYCEDANRLFIIEVRRTETTQTEKLVYATATGGCYNGNISSRTVPGGTYAYGYNTYNRLVSASFSAAEGSTGDYSAEYAYDGHANITSLTRRGVTDTYGGTVTFGLLDGITATLQGNRVTALELSTEAASYEGRTGYGLEGSYTLAYDDNGNVVSDGSRGISSISYNRHDQPVVISFSDGRRITNSYDDAGTLVSRTLRTGGRLPRTTTERYAGPHVGAMAANAVPAVSRSYFEGGYFDAEGKVHYFVTDYQGNVLEDRKARGAVVASTQYYPYGEPWTEPTGGNDRWFGGKERLAAEGLPMSDFGPRLLNHAYPSWHTQDRKLEDYYPLSPYTYCAGNPVRYIDPTGEDIALLLATLHIGMLIQNKNKEWEYFSLNGVNYYESTGGRIGGNNHDNLGQISFESPEAFMNSEFNTKGSNEEKEIDKTSGYEYKDFLILSTTEEQDKAAAEEFKSAAEEGYNLITNNCADAVRKAASVVHPVPKAPISVFSGSVPSIVSSMLDPFALIIKTGSIGLLSISYEREDFGISVPSVIFNNYKFIYGE